MISVLQKSVGFLDTAAKYCADFLTPKFNEPVPLRTHAVAVAALAVTCSLDPVLAAQLGINYVFWAISTNRGTDTANDERVAQDLQNRIRRDDTNELAQIAEDRVVAQALQAQN